MCETTLQLLTLSYFCFSSFKYFSRNYETLHTFITTTRNTHLKNHASTNIMVTMPVEWSGEMKEDNNHSIAQSLAADSPCLSPSCFWTGSWRTRIPRSSGCSCCCGCCRRRAWRRGSSCCSSSLVTNNAMQCSQCV